MRRFRPLTNPAPIQGPIIREKRTFVRVPLKGHLVQSNVGRMWKVIENYKVHCAGLYFIRPQVLLARVEADGAETPLLQFQRGEDGLLQITATILNREGNPFGHVQPGARPVPSNLLHLSHSKEQWRLTHRASGTLVIGIERSWGLDWATLEVSCNMWIHGRPVKILPHTSNVPELQPCPDDLPGCTLRFHQGVTVGTATAGLDAT